MTHPVFVDDVPSAKSNARAYIAYRVPNAQFLRDTDMQGTWVVFVAGLNNWFQIDTSDTTSPDNGTTIIVGPNGERWTLTQFAGGGGIQIDAAGTLAGRAAFNAEAPPFTYLDTDSGEIYIKNSASSGDWSSGVSIVGPEGDNGWSPVFSVVTSGDRRVLRIVDWVGGDGTKPATGEYVGPTGLVATAAEAVDIRGSQGAPGIAGTITIGAVTTVPNGTPADVENVGTPEEAIFNFSIPAGPTGTGLDFDVQVDTLADRDDYDSEPEGFRVLVSDVGDGRAAIYSNLGESPPAWSDPAYVTGSGGALVDGDYGDITVSDDGETWTINNEAVTLAKIQQIATDVIMGRVSALTGIMEQLTPAQARSVIRVRERLTAARTYYLAASGGSDSNDGLSSGAPFATPAHAMSVIAGIDFGGYAVTLQLLNGTYTSNFVVPVTVGQAGTADFTIQGDTTTPSNVLISTSTSCFTINGARVRLQGMRLTTSSGGCIVANAGAHVQFGLMTFGSCTANHILSQVANVEAIGNYTIDGGAIRHLIATELGRIQVSGRTITLTGTPAFSDVFCNATLASAIRIFSNTYSGSATGARYRAEKNSWIETFGAGATALPGNAAGTADGATFGGYS